MSGQISRKHRAAWKACVARMQEANPKERKRKTHSEEQLDNCMPSTDDLSLDISSAREDDQEAVCEDTTINETADSWDYKEWISSLQRGNLQMLYDNYRERFGLQKTAAAEVALCLGLSDKTIRTWRKTFLSNSGQFFTRQQI